MSTAEQLDDQLETAEPGDTEAANAEIEAANAEPEEVEFVLDGEEESQPQSDQLDPKNDPTYWFNQREAKRAEKLEAENELLRKQQVQQPQTAAITARPKSEDFYDAPDPDAAFAKAENDWLQQEIKRGSEAALKSHTEGQSLIAQEESQRKRLEGYAKAANELKVKDFKGLQDNVIQAAGTDFVSTLATSLPPEKATKLIAYFGKNVAEAVKWSNRLETEKGSAVFELGELHGKLAARPTQTNAPNPETLISGKTGVITGDWKTRYEKALDSPNAQALYDLKQEANAAGVDLKSL